MKLILRKTSILFLLLFCMVLTGCIYKPKPDDEILLEALDFASDKLEFVQQYAGNVNLKGSRKFDDTFVTEFRICLDDLEVNYEELEKMVPTVKSEIDEIREEIIDITDLLITMGVTNSDKYVSNIKSSASETLSSVKSLMDRLDD